MGGGKIKEKKQCLKYICPMFLYKKREAHCGEVVSTGPCRSALSTLESKAL
jgi:hypothetical protein